MISLVAERASPRRQASVIVASGRSRNVPQRSLQVPKGVAQGLHAMKRLRRHFKQRLKWEMFEKAYRFSASAIDELNRSAGTPPPGSNKEFALLMVGLAGLLLLFYLLIIGSAGHRSARASENPPIPAWNGFCSTRWPASSKVAPHRYTALTKSAL
jgi:hypothetical protein